MMLTLAETAFLVSPSKPVLILAVVGLWAWALTIVDKDLLANYFPRQMWNGIHLGVGALAVLLWLLIPYYWLGFLIALLLLGSGLASYHFYRNGKLPEEKHWRFDAETLKRKWEERKKGSAAKQAQVQLISHSGQTVEVPIGESELVPIYEAMEQVLDHALPRRAERIDLLANAQETDVSAHIDGVRYAQTKLDPRVGVGVIDYLKLHAGMDVKDRRRVQSGKLKVRLRSQDNRQHTLELSTSGTTKGLSLRIDVDPHTRKVTPYQDLGLIDSQKKQLEAILDEHRWTVLSVCPPHHGMTTTLYSLAARHDPYMTNVALFEPQPEYELEGVHHIEIKSGPDAPTLAQQLGALMLREPNVVLMGAIKEAPLAQVVARFAGQFRFYAGLRQADTLTALKAWAQAVDDPALAAEGMGAVLSQRLVRRLCPTCRVAYVPDPKVLKKLNLPADQVKQLYRATGKVQVKEETQDCPDCTGVGYKGRTAIFEVMVLDDAARAHLARSQFDQLRAHMRKAGMLYLQEAALYKVVEGVTDIKEITRVLSAEAPSAAAASA